jgi:hypothetical protein
MSTARQRLTAARLQLEPAGKYVQEHISIGGID